MRTILVAVTLALAAGCTSDMAFEHRSMLDGRTRGVALEDDSSARVGMFGNTCGIDVSSSAIRSDVDIAMNEDFVRDAFGGKVLVQGSDGLHIFDPVERGWSWGPADAVLPGNDLVDGALTDVGTVGLSGDCSVTWTGDLTGSTQVSDAGCEEASFSVDRETGTAYVGKDGVITAATLEGIVEVAEGDLAVWDSAAEALYVADRGGLELRALEYDGAERWALVLEGGVVSMEVLGARGGVAVMVERTDGSGALLTIDGFTGEIHAAMDLPSAAPEMTSSDSGRTLAVILPGQTHFFGIRGL